MLLIASVSEGLEIKSMKSLVMFMLIPCSVCLGDLRGESLKPGTNRVELVHD